MDYYSEIKNRIIDNEVYNRVKDYSKERHKVITYYEIGKLLSEAGKHYGEGIIKEYSEKLTRELGKGYGVSNLKNIRKFYMCFQKSQALPGQLTWSHICELLSLKNKEEIDYYIDISTKQNLTYRQLREKIKSKEYERLPVETKNKLINEDKLEVKDLIPNPIVIKNKNNIEVISEKVLHQLILEDIESFMKELGNGYSFIGSEYKIKIGNNYNYIDLLLYNIEFNSYVVVELKTTELKKEHIGQIQVYMNYIDNNLKRIDQDKTIGIIITKKDNKFIMEYCSDKRVLSREYKLIN